MQPEKLSASLTLACRNGRATPIAARRFVCLDLETTPNDLDSPLVTYPIDQTWDDGAGPVLGPVELLGVTHAEIAPGLRGDVFLGPAIVRVETCGPVATGRRIMIERASGRVRTLDTSIIAPDYRDGPHALSGATGAGQFVLVRLGPKIL